jgi:hypothetical protein
MPCFTHVSTVVGEQQMCWQSVGVSSQGGGVRAVMN